MWLLAHALIFDVIGYSVTEPSNAQKELIDQSRYHSNENKDSSVKIRSDKVRGEKHTSF